MKVRFSKHYQITEEELTWLGQHVGQLGQAVRTVCAERIALLEQTVRA